MALARFIQLIASVVGIAAGGLGIAALAPPSTDSAVSRLLHIAVTAGVWILAWLGSRKWDRRVSLKQLYRRFLLLTLIFMFFIVSLIVPRLVLRSLWTVDYMGNRVLVGGQLTDSGRAYFSESPNATASEAVWDNAGVANEIWTSASIARRSALLWPLHIAGFGSALFLIILAWYVVKTNLERAADQEPTT